MPMWDQLTRKALKPLLAVGIVAAMGFGSPHGAQAAPKPTVQRDFVVVIDPGHGGTNAGCASHDGHTHEKEVTLEVATALRAELRERLPHAEVQLTRDQDLTLTLAERVATANRVGADLFISIHANASPDQTQSGFETYILDHKASTLEAARTAQRENDEGFVAPEVRNDAAAMVRELALTAARERALDFSQSLQNAQARRFPGRVDRGVRTAPFDVLMGARMPAVLTEIGFLDNAEEGELLLDPEGQAKIVDGMAEAVVDYYRDIVVR